MSPLLICEFLENTDDITYDFVSWLTSTHQMLLENIRIDGGELGDWADLPIYQAGYLVVLRGYKMHILELSMVIPIITELVSVRQEDCESQDILSCAESSNTG